MIVNDISQYQGKINWSVFGQQTDIPNVAGVIQRLTYSRTDRDPTAETNCKGAKSIGKQLGGYAYLYMDEDPLASADFYWNTKQMLMDKGVTFDYPDMVDVEDTGSILRTGPANAIQHVWSFIQRLYQRTNIVPVFYTRRGIFNDETYRMPAKPWLPNLRLMIANYFSVPAGAPVNYQYQKLMTYPWSPNSHSYGKLPTLPDIWNEWCGWQFGSQLHESGIYSLNGAGNWSLDGIFFPQTTAQGVLDSLWARKTLFPMGMKVNSLVGLNVRAAPDPTGKLIGWNPNGRHLDVINIIGNWAEIQPGAWSSMDYLVPDTQTLTVFGSFSSFISMVRTGSRG